MGKFRVFKKSVRFTFRSRRRFLVFLLIIAIISTFIAFYIDSIDELRKDKFLEQKGVITEQSGNQSVTYTQGQNLMTSMNGFPDLNLVDIVPYYYAELDNFLRIYSLDIDRPWHSQFAKPSLIDEGRYPESSNEIIVPSGTEQIRDSLGGEVKIQSEVAVGQMISFERAGFAPIDLEVVGTFDTNEFEEPIDPETLWLFMDLDAFSDLVSMFDQALSDAFTYSISWTVDKPSVSAILNQDSPIQITAIKEALQGFLTANAQNLADYGSWRGPEAPAEGQALEDATTNVIFLGFIVIGGIIVTTMLSYLISRFRRGEIAVVKAMGYSHGSVRLSLIAEILTTAVVAFIIGLSVAQGLLFSLSGYRRSSLLGFESVIVSFAINVLMTLPGMIIMSRRVLGVSPSEAFRDR